MKPQKADWLAWILQFIFGGAIGLLVGYMLISKRRRYYYSGSNPYWLQSNDVWPFIIGAALLVGAIASHFGDRLWVAYRIFPNNEVPNSNFSTFCSIVLGVIGVGLMMFAVVRTVGWVG